ncbi:uncharacterized protein LOC101735402 isoform X1 [Bombyx mori]|uniref:uncharacterized protein LOC101735402 isoform X1 n=1 Tax=Bombyx mori TaxID=7091 RepID=UPI002ED08384
MLIGDRNTPVSYLEACPEELKKICQVMLVLLLASFSSLLRVVTPPLHQFLPYDFPPSAAILSFMKGIVDLMFRENRIWSDHLVFHLRNIRWESPRFLSKSFLAFVTFNLINYSLLAAEVLTTNIADTSAEKRTFYQHIFNGCYAVLLFIVVVFFLIYGVEVFFKLRGEFLKETKVCTIISPRPGTSADGDEAQDTLVTKQGIQTDLLDGDGTVDPRSVDLSQLHQSRVGLISLALMLILIVCFLASETLSEFWKTKVPVVSRNWHDLVFRLAEIGVAVWFPCALWNSMAPERLWLLNPRRLLARQLDDAKLADLLAQHHHDAKTLADLSQLGWRQKAWYFLELAKYWIVWRFALTVFFKPLPLPVNGKETQNSDAANAVGSNTNSNVESDSLVDSVGSSRDCWICYDSSRAEPLIRPCRCTGDVSAVHHDCLSRWLVESAASPDGLKCKVCNTPYIVQETNRVEWERGFTWSHWAGTAAAVTALTGAAAGAWALAQLYPSSLVRVLAAGAALLVCYVALRFLGTNTVSAYHRARVYGLKILTEPFADVQDSEQGQLSTISRTVTVEIAPKDVLDQALKGEAK